MNAVTIQFASWKSNPFYADQCLGPLRCISSQQRPLLVRNLLLFQTIIWNWLLTSDNNFSIQTQAKPVRRIQLTRLSSRFSKTRPDAQRCGENRSHNKNFTHSISNSLRGTMRRSAAHGSVNAVKLLPGPTFTAAFNALKGIPKPRSWRLERPLR